MMRCCMSCNWIIRQHLVVCQICGLTNKRCGSWKVCSRRHLKNVRGGQRRGTRGHGRGFGLGGSSVVSWKQGLFGYIWQIFQNLADTRFDLDVRKWQTTWLQPCEWIVSKRISYVILILLCNTKRTHGSCCCWSPRITPQTWWRAMMMKPEANICIQLLIKCKYGDSPTHVHIINRELCASNRISSRIWLELEDFTLFTTAIPQTISATGQNRTLHNTTSKFDTGSLSSQLNMHNVKPRASSFAAELHCRNELPLTFAQANRLESVCAPTDHAILGRSIFTTRELASRKLPREEKQKKNPSKQKNKSPSSEIRTDENGTG